MIPMYLMRHEQKNLFVNAYLVGKVTLQNLLFTNKHHHQKNVDTLKLPQFLLFYKYYYYCSARRLSRYTTHIIPYSAIEIIATNTYKDIDKSVAYLFPDIQLPCYPVVGKVGYRWRLVKLGACVYLRWSREERQRLYWTSKELNTLFN